MSLLTEYREKAEMAARQAEAATLQGVRERYLHIEATMRAAAARVERSLERRASLRAED